MAETNVKNLLMDLQTELQGSLLQADVQVSGRQFRMRLLNESETAWTFGLINVKSEIAMGLSVRLGTLAAGIRSIDGSLVEDLFEDKWESLLEPEQRTLISQNGSKKFAICKLFMDYLSEMPPDFVNELHKKWQEIEVRRLESQTEIKNL